MPRPAGPALQLRAQIPRLREGPGGKKIACPWTLSKAQAVAWRQEAVVAVRQGRLRASSGSTVAEAAAALIDGMRSGRVLDRKGKPYKPSTVRSYEASLNDYIVPSLGRHRVNALSRRDVQAFVEEMRGLGAAPSTVHNRLDPLRVLVRRAMRDDELFVDPFARLDLPAVRNNRTRIEAPAMADLLIGALPEDEQAFWALALYAGLRRGELQALRVEDIDFDRNVVHVRRGWDQAEGEIDTKTFAGTREIPMMGELRRVCLAHKLATGRARGRPVPRPYRRRPVLSASTVRARGRGSAWGWKQEPAPDGARQKDGRLKLVWVKAREERSNRSPRTKPRHCAASYMIAAGMDWKKITEWIGHSDVRTTYNRYGKVIEEDLADAAQRLDAYFERHREPKGGENVRELGSQ